MINVDFQYLKDNPKAWDSAIIVFTEDSFFEHYDVLSRSYRISSHEKYFDPQMIGRSLHGYCLDGTDQGVRIDYYIHDGGWKIEKCYITN